MIMGAAAPSQAAVSLVNPGFETGDLSGWTAAGEGGQAVTTTYTAWTSSGQNGPVYTAPYGTYFATLPGGCTNNAPDSNTLSQTFTAAAGDKVKASAFFDALDYYPYIDGGEVKMTVVSDSTSTVLFASDGGQTGDYGQTPWTEFTYTVPSTGSYTLTVTAKNTIDCALDAVVGFDIATGPQCTITGTEGADRIRGTSGNDVMCGLGGDDFLDGRGGNDTIYGGDGSDTLVGKGGNDTLFGEAGVDLLLPGSGDDSADGGDGTRDRVLYSDITGGGVHLLLASGSVTPEGASNVGTDTLSNLEQAFGSEQGDVMIAQMAGVASTLKGGGGNDYLDVDDGDGLDTVVGNAGTDTCAVSAGDRARECE
jgi:Ca2+-binding RTX toxin-like protein